jgi:hypothetical protein
LLAGYDEDGRTELEFTEDDGTIHVIYVNRNAIPSEDYPTQALAPVRGTPAEGRIAVQRFRIGR